MEDKCMMLQQAFGRVYSKFKLHFYQKVFEKFQDREATLTTVETFCMEIINTMNRPTVNEFAKVANLSSPNAAYKINHLMKKGYVTKVQSKEDKREYHLQVTEKYLNYYNISSGYMNEVIHRLQERLSDEEMDIMIRILKMMDEEIMKEVPI